MRKLNEEWKKSITSLLLLPACEVASLMQTNPTVQKLSLNENRLSYVATAAALAIARYLNYLEWIFHHHRSVINQIIAAHTHIHTYTPTQCQWWIGKKRTAIEVTTTTQWPDIRDKRLQNVFSKFKIVRDTWIHRMSV